MTRCRAKRSLASVYDDFCSVPKGFNKKAAKNRHTGYLTLIFDTKNIKKKFDRCYDVNGD